MPNDNQQPANPVKPTHGELLAVLQRSSLTADPLDLTKFLSQEQQRELTRRMVAVQQPDIEAKRAEVARFDAICQAMPEALTGAGSTK